MKTLQFYEKENDDYIAMHTGADKNSLGCALLALLVGGVITGIILSGNSEVFLREEITGSRRSDIYLYIGPVALLFGILKIRGYKKRIKINPEKKVIQITYAGLMRKEEVMREWAFSEITKIFKKEKFSKGKYMGCNIEIELRREDGGTKSKKIWRSIESTELADAILEETQLIIGSI